jgi:hypothetical protein
MCGVTEAELERGAVLGPAVFATVSRRENKTLPSLSDGSQKVRRFWTLADHAYDQCRRAITYLEWDMDVASVMPSLRRNSGVRSGSSSISTGQTPADGATPPAATLPGATTPVATPVAAAAPAGPQLGGNGGPFAH